MNALKKSVVVLAAVAAWTGSFAGNVLKGKSAVMKFPAPLQKMGLAEAKWMRLADGVEYYYGRFTNLLGTLDGYAPTTNELHLLRIDYRRAPVKMKFVDHTQEKRKKQTTTETAAREKALFAINMTMEYNDKSVHPQGYAKADGVVIPNGMTLSKTGVKGGFAFNDDKTFAFDPDWTAADPVKKGGIKADAWKNVVTHEAYTIHNGKVTWGPKATYFGRANYPFFGVTEDGVLWAGAVDGRNKSSAGLGYHEVAALQRELGCTEGVCCDGGGSTTIAIRADLVPSANIVPKQKLVKHSGVRYYTMNFLYDGSVGGTLANGSERAVINQLLFVPTR